MESSLLCTLDDLLGCLAIEEISHGHFQGPNLELPYHRIFGGQLLAQAIAIVFLVASLTFFLIHMAPGDPMRAIADTPSVPPEVRAQLRENFGLDRSLLEQYIRYLGNLVRGDLGYSLAERRSVTAAIA